ncbi:MAG TPA: DUF6600 domain-containing protein [Chthoniobacterales bacterium]|nr:DUF6600 domain-containing protein [Chthoniobacterales bacterium]
MKTTTPIVLVLSLLALAAPDLMAGTIFYQPIPAVQSDLNSGISSNNQYTSAIDGGNRGDSNRIINGITLYALSGTGQSSTADNCTVNGLVGSLSNAGGTSASIRADGVFKDVLSDMTFNNGATDGSQQEIVLDSESLEAGVTYDLRVYIGNSSGQSRMVNLAFVGDGQSPMETGFFNEDDARTSAGGFSDSNQVYYINYRFTWDGETTPGVTVTQRSGSAPFVLYALTNQVVPGAAQTAQAPAPAISTGLVTAQQADQVGVQSDDFYTDESLNTNGQWIDIEKYGRCWVPTRVAKKWRPYTNGSWRYSDDDGWVFVSDEPWAWAVYHYGRWVKVEFGSGWAWVPGTVWSGGWVSWREGADASSDYVAWAPLPPEVNVDVGVGVSTWVDQVYDIGPDFWTFVDSVNFGVNSFFAANVIYDFNRTLNVFNNSVNITNINVTNISNITNINNVNIYNGGPNFAALNKQIRDKGGQGLSKVQVDRFADPAKIKGGKHSQLDGDHLAIHSPNVKGDGKHVPKTDAHLASNKVDHGWKDVKGDKRNQIKNHIAQESKGKSPMNTKATLPTDVAQKTGKHQAGTQSGIAGAQSTDTGRHPGKKGDKGIGTQSIAGTQGTATGFNQHPGKKGKQGGASQLGTTTAGTNAGQTGTATGFNQHPGKKGKQGGASQLGATTAGTSATQPGTATGFNQHPGKKGKQGGMTQPGVSTAGVSSAPTGIAGGFNQHLGKKGKQAGATGPLAGSTAGPGVQTGPGKGPHGKKGLQPGADTTAAAGAALQGKGHHNKQQPGLTSGPQTSKGVTQSGVTKGHHKGGSQQQLGYVGQLPSSKAANAGGVKGKHQQSHITAPTAASSAGKVQKQQKVQQPKQQKVLQPTPKQQQPGGGKKGKRAPY